MKPVVHLSELLCRLVDPVCRFLKDPFEEHRGQRRVALALGLSTVGAWVAGALYGFHPYQINAGPRLHIIFHGFEIS